jgi:dynein heavy chain
VKNLVSKFPFQVHNLHRYIGEKPDWDTAKKVLSNGDFLKNLYDYDKDNIPEAALKKLKKYIDDPLYTPEAVMRQSKAAMSLCMWTRAMVGLCTLNQVDP